MASAIHLLYLRGLSPPASMTMPMFDYTLELCRVDGLSVVFGLVFHVAAFLSTLFALRVRDDWQQVGALVYAGAAIAAVFAGDLITLFVFWEITAMSSVFLVWASRNARSYGAGMRYLIIQVGSGVLLLAGFVMHVAATGSIAFESLGLVSLGTLLIFLGFGVKAAFPVLHTWLPDAYPQATATGTVFLSAFTTKLAVYALARGFPGVDVLLWIGGVMVIFPMFYAVTANDLRRVLSYSLIIQLGFMVVGVGLGTELSMNGTAAHATTHILYKALLFMTMGTVLHRVGTAKASELGGLYRTMPVTAACCVVGAASIAAFPLFGGFVSKALILSAAGKGHHLILSLALIFASAGAIPYVAMRVPLLAFFGRDSGRRPPEAPPHMLLAMIMGAVLCVVIGVFPDLLYRLLPYPVDYHLYTFGHVVNQLQLLAGAALGLAVLWRLGRYPRPTPSIVLDADWFYRRLFPTVLRGVGKVVSVVDTALRGWVRGRLRSLLGMVQRLAGPRGPLADTVGSGDAVLWVAVLLAAALALYFV
jgi:multicomponent Na+:H+ antiporter subunit D